MGNAIVKNIQLVTPKDVNDFCNLINILPKGTNAFVSHNGYKVAASSVMGMLSLNLSEPVTLTITAPDGCDDNKIEVVLENLKKWCM